MPINSRAHVSVPCGPDVMLNQLRPGQGCGPCAKKWDGHGRPCHPYAAALVYKAISAVLRVSSGILEYFISQLFFSFIIGSCTWFLRNFIMLPMWRLCNCAVRRHLTRSTHKVNFLAIMCICMPCIFAVVKLSTRLKIEVPGWQ